MDYSESLIYIRTFTNRCEEQLNKRNMDKALEEAEHVIAEALQLKTTLLKMKELS